METKQCPKCGRELPASEFNKCKSNPDGLQSYCRECQHESQRKAYKKYSAVRQDNPLSAYTPRELMLELKKRGYKGKLHFVQEIDLNTLS